MHFLVFVHQEYWPIVFFAVVAVSVPGVGIRLIQQASRHAPSVSFFVLNSLNSYS